MIGNYYKSEKSIPQSVYDQAFKYGVEIAPNLKGKKLDVYRNGKKVASIGDIKYMDYHLYLLAEKNGLVPVGTANQRRKMYFSRFGRKKKNKNPQGYYTQKILWT